MKVQEWLGEDNKLAIDIWEKKYRNGNENFDEWLNRVSAGNEDLKELITKKKFLFGGRILSNRGLNKEGKKISYSNCYVLSPPEDNIESIFEAAKKLARTFSYGGGCGIDISKLSPRGAVINNAAKSTSGSVSFMDLYDLVTSLIGQSGRRGALMLSIDCTHPDLEEFIGIKSDLSKVNKANISVKINDGFMQAVKNKTDFELKFIREETGEEIIKKIKADELFHKLAEMNWDYAEPGMLFWDRIKSYNLLSNNDDFQYAGVNPCAEEPLPAGGSCLLGSINLAEYVTQNKQFDYVSFRYDVKKAIVALNEVLDEGLPLHPLEEQQNSVRDWRQIGLGIMGLADCLIKMGIKYGSKRAVYTCDLIGFNMAEASLYSSAILASKYGTYPKYNNKVLETEFFQMNASTETIEIVKKHGLRNSQLLTCAPTGTISTMLGVSGGIEPIFANYYIRKTQSLHNEDFEYKVYTPIVKEYIDSNNITDDADLPDYFVTSQQLDYANRIEMQAIWQSHIDASISSTVNLPNSATVEDVKKLYLYAWEKGLKGITVYRDGCKRSGILITEPKSKETSKPEGASESTELKRGDVIQVKDDVVGKKRKLMSGCGTLHCKAFFDPATGDILETYFSKGSSGGCNNFMIGLSRMISLSARAGCDVYTIADQLDSCGVCASYAVRTATKKDTSKGSCCPIAIGKALIDMYEEFQAELNLKIKTPPVVKSAKKQTIQEEKKGYANCPECGESLVFEGGCNTCKSCGYSKCS